MKIEFEFELKDWLAFNKHHLNNSKQFKKTKLITTLTFPIVMLFVIIKDVFNNDFHFISATFLVLLSVLWIIFYPKRIMKVSLRRIKKNLTQGDNSTVIGKHIIEFNENDFIVTKKDSSATLKWSAIKKVEKTEDYFFLYDTSVSAIVIPIHKIKNSINLNNLESILDKNLKSIIPK